MEGKGQGRQSEARPRRGLEGEERRDKMVEVRRNNKGGGRTEAKLKVAQVVVGIHKARVQLDGPSDYWWVTCLCPSNADGPSD